MGSSSETVMRFSRTIVALALGAAGSASSGCSILYSTDAISSETDDAGAPVGPGGPSLCDPSHFVFCDGFENGFDGITPVANGGGMPTVDSAHVYRGGQALHSFMPETTVGANVTAQVLLSQPWPAHVFVRFFAFFPHPWSIGADLLTYVDANNDGLALFMSPTVATLAIANFGTNSVLSATHGQVDQWTCFELEVDSTAHLAKAWMNGSPLSDLSETTQVGNLQFLGVGLLYGDASGAWPKYDAWFDEVAVSTSFIGCDQ